MRGTLRWSGWQSLGPAASPPCLRPSPRAGVPQGRLQRHCGARLDDPGHALRTLQSPFKGLSTGTLLWSRQRPFKHCAPIGMLALGMLARAVFLIMARRPAKGRRQGLRHRCAAVRGRPGSGGPWYTADAVPWMPSTARAFVRRVKGTARSLPGVSGRRKEKYTKASWVIVASRGRQTLWYAALKPEVAPSASR